MCAHTYLEGGVHGLGGPDGTDGLGGADVVGPEEELAGEVRLLDAVHVGHVHRAGGACCIKSVCVCICK